jgi:hypothetical protein
LALLCVINSLLNNLDTKLRVKQKLICDIFGAVRDFEMKLKLFQEVLENANLCYFSSCDLLHKDGSVLVPFPSGCAVEF